jgi:hypothetical protein
MTTTHERFCSECGTARSGEEPFCAHCGHHFADGVDEAPTATTEPEPSPESASTPAPEPESVPAPAAAATTSSTEPAVPAWRPWLPVIAAAAAVLVIILVVVLAQALDGGDEEGSSNASSTTDEPTWTELLEEAVDDLDPEREDLSSSIDDLTGTTPRATAVTGAATAYRTRLKGWGADATGLEDEAEPSDDQADALEESIDAEEALIAAILRIGASPSTANRNELERTAGAAADAWAALDDATDGDVEVEPIDIAPLTAWSLARENERRQTLADNARALRQAEARAEAEAAARRAAEAAAAQSQSAQGYVSCANLGEGGAGVINIEGTNVSCSEAYDVIYAVPSSLPRTYSSGGFACEMMDSDSQSWAYICQDGDRSFGFRIIDN